MGSCPPDGGGPPQGACPPEGAWRRGLTWRVRQPGARPSHRGVALGRPGRVRGCGLGPGWGRDVRRPGRKQAGLGLGRGVRATVSARVAVRLEVPVRWRGPWGSRWSAGGVPAPLGGPPRPRPWAGVGRAVRWPPARCTVGLRKSAPF